MPALWRRVGPRPGRRAWRVALGCVIIWLILAYEVAPWFYLHYEHHAALAGAPKISWTKEGLRGDPLNVGLVGSEHEIFTAMLDAGWLPADPVTFRSGLRIGASCLLGRPYPTAPISSLYVWDRPQDMAFQLPVGHSAARRHHVRVWLAPREYWQDGRPFWIGGATYDKRVGLSHYTGQITHHIAADIDHERDMLMTALRNTGQVTRFYQVTGIGPTVASYNGGGDRYYSDGEMSVAVVSPHNHPETPVESPSPMAVRTKQSVMGWIKSWLK